MKFYLYNKDCPHWRTIEGDRLVNSCGGFIPVDMLQDEDVLEVVDVDDWADLDYTKTTLVTNVEPDTRNGWCDRSGKWYPVGCWMHDRYAYYILKKEAHELENSGWVRAHSQGEGFFVVGDNRRLSAEQRNTLSRLGFVIAEDD